MRHIHSAFIDLQNTSREDRKLLRKNFYKTASSSLVDVHGGVGRFGTTEIHAANFPDDGTFRSEVHLTIDVWAENNVRNIPRKERKCTLGYFLPV